jgi:hypothetical protein
MPDPTLDERKEALARKIVDEMDLDDLTEYAVAQMVNYFATLSAEEFEKEESPPVEQID